MLIVALGERRAGELLHQVPEVVLVDVVDGRRRRLFGGLLRWVVVVVVGGGAAVAPLDSLADLVALLVHSEGNVIVIIISGASAASSGVHGVGDECHTVGFHCVSVRSEEEARAFRHKALQSSAS